MNNVYVIGMGVSASDLTAAHLAIIRAADLLVGGRRHLDQFKELPAEKRPIEGRVSETLACIREAMAHRRVVVLASGDPLLHGIGVRIAEEIGRERVTILPNVSSIAAAFARIGQSWAGARVVSLHGRDRCFELLAALTSGASVAVLTDPQRTPGWLADWLRERGVEHVDMAVFERLGDAREQFGWYALDQAAGHRFAEPNLVVLKPILERQARPETLVLGMSEAAYAHEQGLITKAEVRAVTLAKLALKPGMTLWDLGAGSGSVGIEASLLLGAGRIVAVEKDAGRVARIRANARRFGVYNHETIQAELPLGLADLPPPDRIFVGGGGRDLADIVSAAVACLKPEGVLVANVVLLDNLNRIVAVLEADGLAVEVVQLQVSRGTAMPWSMRLEAHNPVWIIRGMERKAG